MHEWCREFELEDAQGPGGGLNTHTVHFAWMRWFKYAKANDRLKRLFHGMPLCITASIDRLLLSKEVFKVRRVQYFNELDEVDRRNEYAQTTISNFSDHYAGALELKMKVGLRLVMLTQK